MARLEEAEHPQAGLARAWLDRMLLAPSDPAYLCTNCGSESAEWRPLCGRCQAFDTLCWDTPPAGPGAAGAALPAPPSELPALLRPASGLAAAGQSDT